MPLDPEERAALEAECDIEFLRGSGPGGQHRNKRDTGVRLTHRPSGRVVMATERRSQAQNLEIAFERLSLALALSRYVPPPRRPSRPSWASVQRRLQGKHRRGVRKAERRLPSED